MYGQSMVKVWSKYGKESEPTWESPPLRILPQQSSVLRKQKEGLM
jgi:hypothetical protein